MASNDSESPADYNANHLQKHNLSQLASANDGRSPAKRSRKAINCDPCRASKLKCDRARPCSSCVLRGTVASCYQDGRGEDGRSEDPAGNRADPHQEIARARQALATIEAHLLRGLPSVLSPVPLPAVVTSGATAASEPSSTEKQISAKEEPVDDEFPHDVNSGPGLLAREGQGSLYTGATCMTSGLVRVEPSNDATDAPRAEASGNEYRPGGGNAPLVEELDVDLREELPLEHIYEGTISFYFEHCNWMYRHVEEDAFKEAWHDYKMGTSNSRLTLATLFLVLAVATHYFPAQHTLLLSMRYERVRQGKVFYTAAVKALARYRDDIDIDEVNNGVPCVELVEALLIRTHYLTLSKTRGEQIWNVCVEVTGVGVAMGLHRDPSAWNLTHDVIDRRRWAWWHIVLLQYWQCFLFGRPLLIGQHTFDTMMPSAAGKPKDDPEGRLYAPNIHLFKLAFVLGGIVDDGVSVRPVSHQRVMDRDRELQAWFAELPKELDMDDYKLARHLASEIHAEVRLGVQSFIIRNSYYHIRFGLHRPYAAAAHGRTGARTPPGLAGANSPHIDEKLLQSLDIAVSSADKLISLVNQSRPELFANRITAVPGHIHWGPFHSFTAALFFSLQLVANPEQPGANLFRSNINKSLEILSHYEGSAVADKGIAVLTALARLYEPRTGNETSADLEVRERKKKEVLSMVYTNGLPYFEKVANRPTVAATSIVQHTTTTVVVSNNTQVYDNGLQSQSIQNNVDIYMQHPAGIVPQVSAPPIYSHPHNHLHPAAHMRQSNISHMYPQVHQPPILHPVVTSSSRSRLPPPPPTPAPPTNIQHNSQLMPHHQVYHPSASVHRVAPVAVHPQTQVVPNAYMAQSQTHTYAQHAQTYASQVEYNNTGYANGSYDVSEDALWSNAMGIQTGHYSRFMNTVHNQDDL